MNVVQRLGVAVVLIFALFASGGCMDMSNSAPKGLDDNQTRAQVMDPLKALVAALQRDPVAGTFAFESCDDNGDPPFRGGSGGTFEPDGVTTEELKKQLVDTLISQGWSPGAGPGKLVYGTTLYKGSVFSVVSINDESTRFPGSVGLVLYGTCDNYGDHKGRPGVTDIIDELKQSR